VGTKDITEVGTETASCKVLQLGNDVHSTDSACFIICCPSRRSDPLAFYAYRTSGSRIRPDYSTVARYSGPDVDRSKERFCYKMLVNVLKVRQLETASVFHGTQFGKYCCVIIDKYRLVGSHVLKSPSHCSQRRNITVPIQRKIYSLTFTYLPFLFLQTKWRIAI
jgi:hypothetical protein